MSPEALANSLKAEARRSGFDLVGVAALGPAETAPAFRRWLAAGFAGEMDYLQRSAALRADTGRPEPGMRSALVVGLNYGGTQPTGTVARYARGDDYHRVMWDKLEAIGRWHATEHGARSRAYVDTGPVLERDLARRAGLGWFGKNTNLINPRLGSFFFIGSLFTDAELAPDPPFETDRCGTCTRCLDACPTSAFVSPGVLDARRCISYLTIEVKGAIATEWRGAIGELLYGCDVCQDVCPWNVRFSRDVTDEALRPHDDRTTPDPAALLALDDASWRERFGRSALTRAKRRGLARNAAVVLGNRRDPRDVPLLRSVVLREPDPVVRDHALWALERFGERCDADGSPERAASAAKPPAQ